MQLEHGANFEPDILESISKHVPNYVDELSTMGEINQWLGKVC